MSASKQIVVQDACVIFDLIDLGLMPSFFSLEITVLSTPQVIMEVLDGDQMNITNEFITDGRLTIDGDGGLVDIEKVVEENSGLSFADSSVLELAIRRNGAVLSSDLKLRNATARNRLTVRGILWVVEELYTANLLTPGQAIEKLRMYERINDRAPRAEIKVLIEKLLKLETNQ